MTDARSLLLLWDVDNVLVDDAGVSAEIYATACELLTGRRPPEGPRADGRLDPEVMAALVGGDHRAVDGPPFEKLVVPALVAAMLRTADALRARGRAAPGAAEALTSISSDPSVIQSVLSGNIAHNALAKLAAMGLDGYVDREVGAFGADNPVRARLVSVARNRAKRKYARHFDRSSTLLVSDTALAVTAARDGAARVIGLATGPDTASDLRDAGADAVLADLVDTAAFRDVVDQLRPA